MLNMTITPQRPALLEGYDNETHALLQITADEGLTLPTREKSLNLAIVIDRSGSMDGRPLDEAKKAAIMMVQRMSAEDRVAVVTYDSEARVIVPSTLCVDRQSIIERIRQVTSGGTTALHDGWLLGAEEVARQKTSTSLNRVLLLSDGNANVGLQDVDAIKSQCAQLADNEVTTSTYGLGHQFNEHLMIGMADAGLGQGYYGETADDLADPFNEEFELLLNTLATRIVMKAETPAHVSMELVNDFRERDGGWAMPDLAVGGEIWALFKLKIARENVGRGDGEVLRCNIAFQTRDGETLQEGPVKLSLDPLAPNAFAAVAEDEKVRRRVGELLVAYYQRESADAARVGDWPRVERIVAEAKLASQDNEWMQQSLAELEKYAHRKQREQFAKEARYSARAMSKRMVSADEMDLSYSLDLESEKAAYLRRKTERGKRM